MDSAKLNEWMQIIGIFALVASLMFVGLQMKQTQEIVAFESLSDTADRTVAFRALLTENADAWTKGCKGEELTDEERTRFVSVYEAYTSHNYISWARSRHGGKFNQLESSVFIRRYALNLYRFPALEKYAASRKNWLGPDGLFQEVLVAEYRALVDSDRARLAEEGHVSDIDFSMCGI